MTWKRHHAESSGRAAAAEDQLTPILEEISA